MEVTHYLVHQPGNGLHEEFETYQEAWEFSELYFTYGHGVAIIEQFKKHIETN
jgi:hypothetical protein